MNNFSQIEQVVAKLVHKLSNHSILSPEHQLWDEHDVATYFKYSLDYTRKHIISNPNFPPARKLPTSIDNKRFSNRWKASDVIKFAMAFDKAAIRY